MTDPNVLSALKKTEKGRLTYDRKWWKQGNINQIVGECSSPPLFQGISPKGEKVGKTPDEKDEENQRIKIKTSTPQRNRGNSITPRITPIDHVIKKVEEDYDSKAKVSYRDRKEMFSQHTAMLLQQAETQLMQLHFHQETKTRQILSKAEAEEKIRLEELKKKQLKLKEHHKQHARLLDARLLEAHKKKKEDEEIERQREAQLRQKLIAMGKIQQEIQTLKQTLEQSLKSCAYLKYVTDGAQKSGDLMTQIQNKVNAVVNEAASTEPSDKLINKVMELQGNAKNVHEFVHKMIDSANKKGYEEASEKEKKKQEELKKKQEEEQKKQQQLQQQSTSGASGISSLLLNQNDTEVIYEAYKTMTESTLKSYEPLLDASHKKIKFDLQKAVNIPVNAISRTSGSFLRDKLSRLTALLSGQPVEVSGKKVSKNVHPSGYNFVKDLLAKKIVTQGEQQVASSVESAFPIAAVTAGIWAEFPDVGEIILAHFIMKCPYLVPYYIPKVEGQTDEDYYRALGYKYESSKVEQQDKFLKRMTGLMYLYSAILISTPPNHQQVGSQHPHGIEHGWIWLTRLMNLEPRPDITATMIHNFLLVAGHQMMQTYGRQFQKLLRILKEEFMPKIKAVTLDGAGGPLMRLELFLDKCVSRGSIPAPEGTLSHAFWMS